MIKAGDTVRIRREWQDAGDDQITWVAMEDEDGGRVRIQPQIDVPIKPNQVVTTDMLMPWNSPRAVDLITRDARSEVMGTAQPEHPEN